MAKISDMLLSKDFEKPEGDLEPARKAVEEYKKLIENHPELHGYYKADECVGFIEYNGDGRGYMSLMVAWYIPSEIQHSINENELKVYFDHKVVNDSQLDYFLRQEGLYVRIETTPNEAPYHCIYIHSR